MKSLVEKIGSSSNSRMQWIVFLSLVIDLLGFTVILPLFPALLEYYSKNDSSGMFQFIQSYIVKIQTAINIPESYSPVFFGGVLGSMYSLLQFLSSSVTGALSDAYGRKPIFLLTLIGISLSYLTWVLSSTFSLFVLARVIGGLSKGNVSLSYCIMTDISDTTNRSKGMALIGVAFSIGFIVGPIVGVLFSTWGSSGWFAASACYAFLLSLLNIVYTFFIFKETLPKEKRKSSIADSFKNSWNFLSPARLFRFQAVQKLDKKERSELQRLSVVYFLFIFIFSGLEFTITFVTHHIHGFNSIDQGKMFTYLGVIMTIVQGGYIRKVKNGKEKFYTLMGLAIMVPSFMIIGLGYTTFVLYFGLTFYIIGSSMVNPLLSTLASKYGSESEKGTIFGIWRSLGALARSVGPVIASICFWSLGATWTYMIGGLLLLVPFQLLRNF